MSTCCLGDSFDIHGGGNDLEFPHHENEIAQSEAATGKPYAKSWLHCGMITINGEKMSKSLGNFFTIREVLEKYHPEVVRYLLIASHYRSPINYSEENLREAKAALDRFYNALKGCPRRRRRKRRSMSSASPRRWTTTSIPRVPARCCSSWRGRSIVCAKATCRRRPRWPRA